MSLLHPNYFGQKFLGPPLKLGEGCYHGLYYVADLIKKLELRLMLVSVLLKINFGQAQVCVSRIGIPMLKIACINLYV